VLLGRIPFDRLLLVKRKPFVSDQPFMDAHHKYNPPGGGYLPALSRAARRKGLAGRRFVGCRHISRRLPARDADRLLFAFGNGQDPLRLPAPASGSEKQSYHVYEVRTDGSALRQLTTGRRTTARHLSAKRADRFHVGPFGPLRDVRGDIHGATLYLADGDGGNVRRLSFNVFNDFTRA